MVKKKKINKSKSCKASDDRLLPSALPAGPVDHREQEGKTTQAGEHGGRQVDLVQTEMLILLHHAVGIAMRLVHHDSHGGASDCLTHYRLTNTRPPVWCLSVLSSQRGYDVGEGGGAYRSTGIQ